MRELSVSRILFANTASVNPALIVVYIILIFMLALVFVAFLAGGLLGLRRMMHRERKSPCSVKENLVLIGKILLGFLTSWLLIGLFIFGIAVHEAYRMFCESCRPR